MHWQFWIQNLRLLWNNEAQFASETAGYVVCGRSVNLTRSVDSQLGRVTPGLRNQTN
jgi:hypothetical protein